MRALIAFIRSPTLKLKIKVKKILKIVKKSKKRKAESAKKSVIAGKNMEDKAPEE
ncbi:MAG: hypothetical protein ACK401_00575 [Archaeoglobaceae archaeon]